MPEEDKGKLLTAAQVAEIWNERAREMGFPDTNYTRFSVRQRHRKARKGHMFTPAVETPIGFLYWEQDARTFPLQPQKSKKR
jgi:hypothetical protein